jgi:hypothetical protein
MANESESSGAGCKEVVLPLYSIKAGEKYVPERSGINQWLASGRVRRFGECYFPVPIEVHRQARNFFPPQGQLFKLILPGDYSSRAKLCQSGSKALMTSPNHHLGLWLYKLIDSQPGAQAARIASRTPFGIKDLEALGFDCVRVSKNEEGYVLEPLEIGGYESWVKTSFNEASKG